MAAVLGPLGPGVGSAVSPGAFLPFWSPLFSHSYLSLLSLALREFAWVLTLCPARSIHRQKSKWARKCRLLGLFSKGWKQERGPSPHPQEAPRGGRWAQGARAPGGSGLRRAYGRAQRRMLAAGCAGAPDPRGTR